MAGIEAHHQDVVLQWKNELAEYLGRPADELMRRGLRATDFGGNRRVRLLWADGSAADFRSAFALVSPERNQVGVFTEHCGYLAFPLVTGMEVAQVTEDAYRHA